MVTNMRLLVDAPPYTPSPYGLLSVADMRSEGDQHWQAGVTWQSNCGDSTTTFDECISSSPAASGIPTSKGAGFGPAWRGATPFTVFAEIDCSSIDFYDRADQLATEALTRNETYTVERAFWSGIVDHTQNIAYPHLAADDNVWDPNSVHPILLQQAAYTVTGTGVDPVCALAMLENDLAIEINGQGVIHMPNELAVYLMAENVLIRDGNRLLTPNGNVVVVGNGYTGTGPNGENADGVLWMYSTGRVFGYRSSIRILKPPGAFDRSLNTVKVIAERNYVMAYDCYLAGVPVCLPCDNCVEEPTTINVEFLADATRQVTPPGITGGYVTIIDGGSGGGSGRRGAAGTVRQGGGGGSSGASVRRMWVPVTAWGSTFDVVVGTGGAGGAAVTVDDTDGNNGTAGEASSLNTGVITLTPINGTAGGGGTTGAGGLGGSGSSVDGASGGSASATGGAGGGGGYQFTGGAAGGAAGGGISAANAPASGGQGGAPIFWSANAYGVGGIVDTTAPTSPVPLGAGLPGGGGGGGASSVTTAGQNGAAGSLYGGGAAGGGASLNGNNSGAGGVGGAGYISVEFVLA